MAHARAPAGRRAQCRDAGSSLQGVTIATAASRHFGEAPSACNSMCDVCAAACDAHAVERRDISAAALAVVRTLAEWPSAEKRATLIQLIDRWRASKMPADAKAGKAMSREDNERVIGQLLYSGYLQFDFSYTAYATNAYLKASQRASSILQGKATQAYLYDSILPAVHAPGTCLLSLTSHKAAVRQMACMVYILRKCGRCQHGELSA